MKIRPAGTGPASRRDEITGILAETVTAGAFTSGAAMIVTETFSIPVDRVLIMTTALPAAAVTALSCRKVKNKWIGLAVLGALLLAVSLLMSSYIFGGAEACWDFIRDALGKASSFRLKEFALGDKAEEGRAIAVFVGIMTAILSAGTVLLIRVKSKAELILPAAFALFITEATTLGIRLLPSLLIIFSGVMAVGYTAGERSDVRHHSSGMKTLTAVMMVILFGTGVLSAVLIASPSGYMRNDNVTALSLAVDEAIHKARYGGDSGGLTDGDFTALTKRDPGNETSLKVYMSEPESMYLKGFVGSMLGRNGWETLKEESYYKSDDMFYALHQNGFRGNCQLASARDTVKNSKLSDKKLSFSVENVKASSEYMYLPYETVSVDSIEKSMKDRSDETAAAKGLFGKREYSAEINGNLVKDFPDLAAQVYLSRDEKDKYTENESWYNEFVYKNYLQISEGCTDLFKEKLGYRGKQKKGHIDYYSAIRKIMYYLDDNLIYTDLAGRYEGDFISGTLNGGKARAVHYATLAAMMFRYYGIPARYVEGYVITPEDAKKASPAKTSPAKNVQSPENAEGTGYVMDIPASNAHSWVEIYVDGTGWVPVEMTPYMRDIMEQPDYTKGLEADSVQVAKKPKENEEPLKQSEADPLKNIAKVAFLTLAQLLLAILIAFDIFAVLFFIVTSVRRFIANRRRKKAFGSSDLRAAVCSMVGYMTSLARYRSPWIPGSDVSGISSSLDLNYEGGLSGDYMEAMEIGRKARFSSSEITKEERDRVARCKDRVFSEIKKQEQAYSRWVMKYIERLF